MQAAAPDRLMRTLECVRSLYFKRLFFGLFVAYFYFNLVYLLLLTLCFLLEYATSIDFIMYQITLVNATYGSVFKTVAMYHIGFLLVAFIVVILLFEIEYTRYFTKYWYALFNTLFCISINLTLTFLLRNHLRNLSVALLLLIISGFYGCWIHQFIFYYDFLPIAHQRSTILTSVISSMVGVATYFYEFRRNKMHHILLRNTPPPPVYDCIYHLMQSSWYKTIKSNILIISSLVFIGIWSLMFRYMYSYCGNVKTVYDDALPYVTNIYNIDIDEKRSIVDKYYFMYHYVCYPINDYSLLLQVLQHLWIGIIIIITLDVMYCLLVTVLFAPINFSKHAILYNSKNKNEYQVGNKLLINTPDELLTRIIALNEIIIFPDSNQQANQLGSQNPQPPSGVVWPPIFPWDANLVTNRHYSNTIRSTNTVANPHALAVCNLSNEIHDVVIKDTIEYLRISNWLLGPTTMTYFSHKSKYEKKTDRIVWAQALALQDFCHSVGRTSQKRRKELIDSTKFNEIVISLTALIDSVNLQLQLVCAHACEILYRRDNGTSLNTDPPTAIKKYWMVHDYKRTLGNNAFVKAMNRDICGYTIAEKNYKLRLQNPFTYLLQFVLDHKYFSVYFKDFIFYLFGEGNIDLRPLPTIYIQMTQHAIEGLTLCLTYALSEDNTGVTSNFVLTVVQRYDFYHSLTH